MWAGMLHLFVGNFIIGIGEGLIIAWFFRMGKLKSIAILIVANYFSAWIGGLLLELAIVPALPLNIYNASLFLWLIVVVTFFLTLVLEFPFVALIFRKDTGWLGKTIKGSLIIQTISYVVLFGWYWMASNATLLTDTRIAELLSISLPEDVVLYYISPDGGKVYMRNLNELKASVVYEFDSKDHFVSLVVKSSETDPNRLDLAALIIVDSGEYTVDILRAFVTQAAVPTNETDTINYGRAWRSVGEVPKLGDAKQSEWTFRTWALSGLVGRRNDRDEKLRIAFETPLAFWIIRNATHLPGDIVLFQLGDDQICVFDVDSRKLALVVRGQEPVAVLREK